MAKKQPSEAQDPVEFLEDAIVEETIPQGDNTADYNPLGESVKERSYTKPNIDGANLEADIDEPVFAPPSFQDMQEPTGFEAAEEQPFANPAMNDLDDKDKKYATEQMVDTVLDGYEKITGLANNLVQIKDRKIQEMVSKGEIDPRTRIPIDASGNSITISEFVQDYNEQTAEAIQTTPEFKKKVRPAMVRVFEKRGIGMTDEQFLMYMFGTDMVQKGAVVFSLRNNMQNMMNMMKEMSQQKMSTQAPPPPTPSPVEKEPVKQEAKPEPVEFIEPEEEVVGFEDGGPTFDGAPEFGDPAILSELERLSEEDKAQPQPEKPKRKRGRPRKTDK
jgi:hypothetical protein